MPDPDLLIALAKSLAFVGVCGVFVFAFLYVFFPDGY